MPRFDCKPENTRLLLVDIQERFVDAIPAIAPGGAVAQALQLLLRGCQLLGLSTLVTRQYPKGLGETLGYLRDHYDAGCREVDKTHFSVFDDPGLRHQIAEGDPDYLIIAGIEAHVCLLASVDDALTRGYQVLVAADAVASRQPTHAAWALEGMRQLGALVLPVESILFRLQRQAGVGSFKALRDLVK